MLRRCAHREGPCDINAMNLKSMLVAGAATVAGVAGGVAVYQVTAPAETEHVAAPEAVAATPKARAAKGETRYAPCRPPSVLEAGKCVTTAVRTVTLPAPAAPAAPASASSSGSGAAAPSAPAPQAAAPAPAPAPAAPAPAAPAQQPAQQPAAGHPAGGAQPDYEDSDCQKWHEGDADDEEEAQDDYEDCMEDSAEEQEDRDDDDRDDRDDDRDDGDDDRSGSNSGSG
jgi:hypothetical protein